MGRKGLREGWAKLRVFMSKKEACGGGRGWDSGPGVSGFRACEKLSYGQSTETIDSFLAALGQPSRPLQREGRGLGLVSEEPE